MDATTLYVIVMLANGELHTMDAIPQPSNRESCATAAQRARYEGWWTNFYVTRTGAKSVLIYCAPRSKTLVIAR